MARIITITSGKGGVGKTNISVNLALYLASLGYRTCLFDADLGLANINILLGLNPEYDLEDVILNGKNIEDILIRDFQGMDIIPGSSGIPRIADLGPERLGLLMDALSGLRDYDFILFDTSAGISRNVISFCMAADDVFLVVTPEPTSLTDGYSLLKVLSLNGYNKSVMVTVNLCKNVRIAGRIFKKLKDTVEKYLPIRVLPFGTVVQDPHVVEAVTKQQAFISLHPHAEASKCIKNISRHLLRKKASDQNHGGPRAFWNKFVKIFSGPLHVTGIKMQKKDGIPESGGTGRTKMTDSHAPVKTESLSETAAQVLRPAGSPPFEVAGKDQAIQDIQYLLCQLVENTSAISHELGAIRRAVQKW